MTTKETALDILGGGGFVSGESLAKECNVSRAAVNKAIKTLRDEGYGIEAVTNKGYRLVAEPDRISEGRIRQLMESTGANPGSIETFTTIDSTNTEAKRRCASSGGFRKENGELTENGRKLHRSIIVSGQQTAGRGRMGRAFASPANSGIYFTIIYSPRNGITNPALLTAAAAVAVCQAVDELYGLDGESGSRIKWVNDVFLPAGDGFKKISGILTEGISNFETGTIEAAIVGIGINVRDGGFSGELAKVAGSVEDILKEGGRQERVERNRLVAAVAGRLLAMYDRMEGGNTDSAMIEAYKAKSMLTGRTVTVNPAAGIEGDSYMAKVVDITDGAELVVEDSEGRRKNLHSGEVSLHSYDFV
jgi:BirA family biotin operon repressor/biotin-[acetyl-CoA-carboxylase] ligase